MEIIERISHIATIKKFLSACHLPESDIEQSDSLLFFGSTSGADLAGMIGLEVCGSVALLRSLAVASPYRNVDLGKRLVDFAEDKATELGICSLFLLTTTADRYFLKLGYAVTLRETAPAAISNTAQFSSLCPDSFIFMSKQLSPGPN